jgi:hypothetical protein
VPPHWHTPRRNVKNDDADAAAAATNIRRACKLMHGKAHTQSTWATLEALACLLPPLHSKSLCCHRWKFVTSRPPVSTLQGSDHTDLQLPAYIPTFPGFWSTRQVSSFRNPLSSLVLLHSLPNLPTTLSSHSSFISPD